MLVAGSFDPVTLGHMTLIKYASEHYEEVYAVLFINVEKTYLFSLDQRRALLEAACAPYENVRVDAWEGMQYLYARDHGIGLVIRGYRSQEDLEYEKKVADFNRNALPGFETILLPCSEELCDVSSTMVRDLLVRKGDVSPFVPVETLALLSDFAEKANWNKM
ncbi:MAG: pantetheine-phosphate adenylyltransferase [Clostridia bacterium]|nr:pantetheine-phosphate adenylyltransferase [Clostridia bacterium]